MAKKNPNGNGNGKGDKSQSLKDWPEVDQALRRMGEIEIALLDIEGAMNLQISKVKEEAVNQASALKAEYKALEKKITSFCGGRKEEFAKNRTKTLNFGTVAYRVVKKISIASMESCIAALKALGLDSCIKKTEKINKEAMEALDDNTLVKCGAERKTTDTLKIEPNLEKLRTPVEEPFV
ncbi:MAG: host-nuclease inhibitor Gam family protein [bacterium]